MVGNPWYTIPDWWAAIGTISAVAYAIFHEWMLALWRRPKLEMSTAGAPPDCVKTTLTSQRTDEHLADRYHFRLRVKNTGQSTAENVEVYAERLERQGDNGGFKDVDGFPPMDLLWAHVGRSTQSISPGLSRHCELGFITGPKSWEEAVDGTAKFCFDLEVKPNQGGYEVGAGTYRLTVTRGASNVKPQKKVIDLRFEGQWYPDESEMFSQGTQIKVTG
jgi:hypothetical protein